MKVPRALILGGGLLSIGACAAQDTLLLAFDEHYLLGDPGDDPSPELGAYETFNAATGGDSLRLCGAFPCNGWVQDHYQSGQLMHRGYYTEGRLVSYRNFHMNGAVEREFKEVDALRCTMRTWHANGELRSETRYSEGTVMFYADHYVTGQLRYAEERHKKEPCFTRLELYAADGKPISLLRMVDKGKMESEQQEFHPGGALRCQGRARYSKLRMDSQRVGTWTYYDPQGAKLREEDYIDGKVHAVR